IENSTEAIWIERHINALSKFCENEVWHVQTKGDGNWSYSKRHSNRFSMWRIQLPTSRWIIIEIVTFMQLIWLGIRFRERIRNVDVINFHIAYPSLVFWKLLKPLFRRPVVITEHWSGYHFNFGVCRPLRRIMGIFSHNIPVIAVSQALGNDIR